MEELAHQQLRQLWQYVDVAFRVFPKRKPPEKQEDEIHLPIIAPKEEIDNTPVHKSRDHDFHRILGITRPLSRARWEQRRAWNLQSGEQSHGFARQC